jgi:hypothetical protein
VSELESRGEAQSRAITTAAEAHASRIRAFADAYAAEIRQTGDLEAEQYVAQMNESPELAVFLKSIEFIRTATAKRITWIVNNSVPGFELMSRESARVAEDGSIPGVARLMGSDPAAESTRIAGQSTQPGAPADVPSNPATGERK